MLIVSCQKMFGFTVVGDKTTMPYKFFEDIAIADVAYEANGKTIEEMFESAALALTNSMVSDISKIKKKIIRKFELKSKSEEQLLHDFLQELIFYKDAQLLLFSDYRIKVEKACSNFVLNTEVKGEKLDAKKHDLLVDVKAVSWHRFSVQKTANASWQAFVILDV